MSNSNEQKNYELSPTSISFHNGCKTRIPNIDQMFTSSKFYG